MVPQPIFLYIFFKYMFLLSLSLDVPRAGVRGGSTYLMALISQQFGVGWRDFKGAGACPSSPFPTIRPEELYQPRQTLPDAPFKLRNC